MICENITVNGAHLEFAGVDTVKMAEKYGTPLFLMDENRIREKCRIYINAMKKHFGETSFPLFASKALCFKRIYEIMKEEDMGIDLVSSGEIYTAARAGFNMEKSFFHGNNKTDEDIAYAMDNGVGYFVADSIYELSAVDAVARQKGIKQKMLLRLTPGIDPHTYAAVATGKVDSKFGVAIETGQAELFLKQALTFSNLDIKGFHCHVGSQVFDEQGDVYLDASTIMLHFAKKAEELYGFRTEILNMGGGFGVRYTDADPFLDIEKAVESLAKHIKTTAAELGISMPKVIMEPGRSIVADAGMTLYTVGTLKEITGYKNYASVDGGMTDNPRYALYGSKYTLLLANRMNEECDFTCDVVGRCCESGDVIQPEVRLPKPVRGDIVAVCTTGAYNFSMASNYNRIPRPPVVMLADGKDYVAVKRETFAELAQRDV